MGVPRSVSAAQPTATAHMFWLQALARLKPPPSNTLVQKVHGMP
jgi:hypothetical protein